MPRQLVRVPLARLDGAHRIELGYPKSYTLEQMRAWADDLDRLNQTPPEALEGLWNTSLDQLNDEQRARLAAYNMYYGDGEGRIKGSLLDGDRVELENGSHRVAYMKERSVDSVPVWVWASDARQLEQLRMSCESDRLGASGGRSLPQTRVTHDRDAPNEIGAERVR